MDNMVGKVLGNRYEILEKIGIGGMATVYKAKCQLLNRYVAVKILKEEFSKDTLFVKRFKVEAQSAASLTHPNIVSVYDVGEDDGINYIVMELLEGDTLKDYVDKKGKLDPFEVINLSIQIASALEAAHKSKIIHRDIKPQNIVLTRNMTQAKVTDFGIAKMSSSATITSLGSSTIGSVHYFSPEHAKGGYTDEKSDIYSLGVVMYEMATGVLPFNAESPVSVALKQIQESPKEPKDVNNKISDALNTIILKAMAKNTQDRYQSATELLEDLNEARSNPDQKFIKSNSDVFSSATQVIPIVGMKDLKKEREKSEAEKPYTRKASRRNYDTDEMSDASDGYEGKKSRDDIEDKESDADDIFAAPKKKKMSKKKMYVLMAVGVVILGIIIGLGINLISRFGNKNKTTITKAPDLVGKVYEDVKIKYKEKGLTIALDKYDYSSEYEEGKIISQDIKKGKELPSSRIEVVVSKGAKIVKMIDVVGKEYTVAKYDLEALELVPEFEFVENDDVAENLIISQENKKGEELKAGDIVKIVVSKGNGKAKVLVPNVTTMSEAEAKKTLQELKLNVTVKYSEDKSKLNNVVLSQSQKQNAEVEEGALIEITVNRVQKTKVVPIAIGSIIEDDTVDSVKVRVTAKVEGVTNTIYEKTINKPYSTIDVSVNGYTTAVLMIYIDNGSGEFVLKSEQTVNFE